MILFKNVNIFNGNKQIERNLNVAVKNGYIADIYQSDIEKAEYSEYNIIECKGKLLAPSFVDLHTHLREPGFEYKETVETGALSAKAGGFTDICCMANTSPPIDNESVIKLIKDKGRETGINIYPIASITSGLKGERLSEFGHLIDAGAVGFSDDGVDVENSFLMKTAFEYASFFKKTVFCHCEDKNLAGNGSMNDGYFSTLAGLRGIPAVSEDVNVYRNIRIAEYTGAKIHICHASTSMSVEAVKSAKERGVSVTVETCPHYLTLTDEDVYKSGYNTNFKMNPPLRSEFDRESLIKAINNDTVDCIATDHAPHAEHEKKVEFEYAPFGIIGLELAFPVCYQLVKEGKISLEKLISKLSVDAAPVINIKRQGIQKEGVADIVLIDTEKRKRVTEKNIFSKSKNTPFLNKVLQGWIILTVSKGSIVFSI